MRKKKKAVGLAQRENGEGLAMTETGSTKPPSREGDER